MCRACCSRPPAMSAMLLYIITNAVLFTFLLTHEQIPQAMADWLIHQGFGPSDIPVGGERHPARSPDA